jgi:hypothetical protein
VQLQDIDMSFTSLAPNMQSDVTNSVTGLSGLGNIGPIGQNSVADQTQQMANNPIYGQQSPFQPPLGAKPGYDDPMARQSNSLLNFVRPGYDDPGYGGSTGSFGKGMIDFNKVLGGYGSPAPVSGLGNVGPIGGISGLGNVGPIGQGPAPVSGLGNVGPIGGAQNRLATPQPGGVIGSKAPIAQPNPNVGGSIGSTQYRGGLRPAPANYRPPMRRR